MAQKFNIVAELQLQGPSNLNQVVNRIQSKLSSVQVNVNLNAAAATKQTAQLNRNLSRLNQSSSRASRSVRNVSNQLQAASSSAEAFGKQSALAVKRFAAFSVSAGVMAGVVSALKSGTSAAIEFERELVKVSQVTGKSMSSLGSLQKEITSLSTSLGVSSQELVQVSKTLAQTGLNAKEVTTALKALAQSSLAPTFKDMGNTVEGAISIMRQFGTTADNIGKKLGSINALAGSFAVEAQDLVFAVRRAGGAFKAAGGSLEELLALFTSVRGTTRESAETIATGFRTIFTRMQRPKTIAFLRETGVELQNLEGNFVGPFKAVERLSKALNKMESTDPRFMQIIEELGGFRQVSKVIPLIQQFSTAQKALGVAMQGQGSLAKDAETAQQSLAVQIVKVKEEFLALSRSIVGTDTFKGIAQGALSFASSLIKITEAVKPMLPLLASLAAFKTLQLGVQFGGGFLRGMRSSGGAGGGGRRMATGGLVPGVGNTDTVPAMLTPGEFVIRKSSVEKYGPGNLARMNRGGRLGDVTRRRRFGAGAQSYANRRSRRFGQRAMGSRKAYVFDFDDTLAVSDAVVREGADDPFSDFRGRRGASFVRSAKATKIASMARTRASRGHDIHVLTARPGDRNTRSSIGHFMRGIGAPAKSVIGVAGMPGPGGTALKKASVLSRLKGQYGRIVFLDDDKENILAAGGVKGVKAIRARKAMGGIIQRFAGGSRGTGVKKPKLTKEQRAQLNNPPVFDVDGAHGIGFLQRGGYTGKTEPLEASISTLRASTQKKLQQVPSIKTASQRSVFGNELFRKIKISTSPHLYSLDGNIRKNFQDRVIGDISKKIKEEVNHTFDGAGAQDVPIQDLLSKSGLNSTVGQIGEGFVRLAVAKSPRLTQEEKKTDPEFDFSAGSMKDEAFKVLFGAKPQGPLELKNTQDIDKPDLISKAINEKEIPSTFRKRAVKKAAGGGISGSDSVPALLTPGEYVINKASAQRIGYGTLNAINQGNFRGYNTGGPVRPTTMGQGYAQGAQHGQASNAANSLRGLSSAAQGASDTTRGLMDRMQMLYFLPSIIQSVANTFGMAGESFQKVTDVVNQAVMSFVMFNAVAKSSMVQRGITAVGQSMPGGRRGATQFGQSFGRTAGRFSVGARRAGYGPRASRMLGAAGGLTRSAAGIAALGAAASTAAILLQQYGQSLQQAAMDLAAGANATEQDFERARQQAQSGRNISSAGTGGAIGVGLGVAAGGAVGGLAAPAIGAAIGTTIAPVIGTVIGAGIGALVAGGVGLGAGYAMSSGYDADLEKQIHRTRMGQTSGRIQENISGIGQEGVSTSRLTSLVRDFGVGMEQMNDAFDFQMFKEFQKGLKQQVPAMREVVSRILQTSSSFADFESKYAGQGAALLRTISQITRVPYEDLKEEIEKEIQLRQRLNAAAEAQERAIRSQEDAINSMNIFRSVLQDTADIMRGMGEEIDNQISASRGGPITTRIPGFTDSMRGGILGRAAQGERVNLHNVTEAIEQIAPTEDLREMAQSTAEAADKLPAVLLDAAKQSKLSGDKLENTLEKGLDEAGITGAVADAIQANIMGTVTDQGSEASLVNEIIGGGAAGISAEAIETTLGAEVMAGFQQIADTLQEHNRELDRLFTIRNQAERRLAELQINFLNTRDSNNQLERQVQGRAAGQTAAEVGPEGAAWAMGRSIGTQRALLGAGRGVDSSAFVSTNAADVGVLGARLQEVQAEMQQGQQTGQIGGVDVTTTQMQNLALESQQLTSTLSYLAESTDTLRNAQDRAAAEATRREFRTGVATDFAFGTQDQQQQMGMGMAAVDAFERYSRNAGGLGPQALNQMGEAGQQAAAGGRQMLERMAAAGVQYRGRDASEILQQTTRRQLTAQMAPMIQSGAITQADVDAMVSEQLDPSTAETQAINDLAQAQAVQEAAMQQQIQLQTTTLDGALAANGLTIQGIGDQIAGAVVQATQTETAAIIAVQQAIRDQQEAQDAADDASNQANSDIISTAQDQGIGSRQQAQAVVEIASQQERQALLQQEADAMLPEAFRGVTDLPETIRQMAGTGEESLAATVLNDPTISQEGRQAAFAIGDLATELQGQFEQEGLINDDGGDGGRRRREAITRDALEERGFDVDSDMAMEIQKKMRNLVDSGTWTGGMDADEERKALQDTMVNSMMQQGRHRTTRLEERDAQQATIDAQRDNLGITGDITPDRVAAAQALIGLSEDDISAANLSQTTGVLESDANRGAGLDVPITVAQHRRSGSGGPDMDINSYTSLTPATSEENRARIRAQMVPENIPPPPPPFQTPQQIVQDEQAAQRAQAAAQQAADDAIAQRAQDIRGDGAGTSLEQRRTAYQARTEGVGSLSQEQRELLGGQGVPQQITQGQQSVQQAQTAQQSQQAAQQAADDAVLQRAQNIRGDHEGTTLEERRTAYQARTEGVGSLSQEQRQLLGEQEIPGGGSAEADNPLATITTALGEFTESEQLSASLNHFVEQFGGGAVITHQISGTDVNVNVTGLEGMSEVLQEEIISQVITRLRDNRDPNPDPSQTPQM